PQVRRRRFGGGIFSAALAASGPVGPAAAGVHRGGRLGAQRDRVAGPGALRGVLRRGRDAACTGVCTLSRRGTLHRRAADARSAPSRAAFAGGGGWARTAIGSLVREHYVAFCDVDETRPALAYSHFPDVPRYTDVRRMFDRHGDEIDAVVVTTPDHSHYPLAMMCMDAGKHVYLEKPMATTPWECRSIAAAARATGVTTQLGIQGHSAEGLRVLREWVEAGVVGPVREVWFWTDRTEPRISEWSEALAEPQPVPETLNWRGWLAD